MVLRSPRDRRIFEAMLIVVTVGITCIMYKLGAHKLVALNLFYLPIVLAGYYLGRTTAGILALFAALAVTVVTTLDATGFAAYTTPVMMGLALTIWAAVLGLTSILVGTLCDERARTVDELQEAYVGVVEVLSKYLQSANPKFKAKSTRVAELSQMVAQEMKLARKQIDDIRVGSLLHDLENVEVTTQVLSRAVDSLETASQGGHKHTFLGQDLVHSLGSVLSGAVPLVMSQDDAAHDELASEFAGQADDMPVGARIIRAARAYDSLTASDTDKPLATPEGAFREMRRDGTADYDPEVLVALERVVRRATANPAVEQAALV